MTDPEIGGLKPPARQQLDLHHVDGDAGRTDGEDEEHDEAQHPADGGHDVTSVRNGGGR